MRKRIGWAVAHISTRFSATLTPAIDRKIPLQTVRGRAAFNKTVSALHRQKKTGGGTIVVVGARATPPAL
jgi:hypothetical protein